MFVAPLKSIASHLYSAGVRWRLRRYHSGRIKINQLNAPVISVGNLTVGGTGKTPCTAFIANFLKTEGLQIAILSRGYKRQSKGLVEVSNGKEILCDATQSGDEPYLLAKLCPGVRVVVNADRHEAGKWLESKTKIDVFVLDDGYQHIQLHRDLNVLLVDGANPFGNGELLPSGILREPSSEIRRANVIIATRSQHANRAALQSQLLNLQSTSPLFFAQHEITNYKLLNAATPLQNFEQAKVTAFSGIATPERFFADLQQQRLEIVYKQSFPDHHRYTPTEIESFLAQTASRHAAAIITTEKDAANLPPQVLTKMALPVYAAQLQFCIENESEFQQLMREKIRR